MDSQSRPPLPSLDLRPQHTNKLNEKYQTNKQTYKKMKEIRNTITNTLNIYNNSQHPGTENNSKQELPRSTQHSRSESYHLY